MTEDMNVLRSPPLSDLADFVSDAHRAGDLVTVHATCEVEFTGGREGEIGPGDRVIICKPDGAVTVHRPTGARAVARQGIRSSLEVVEREDCLRLFGSKERNKSIRVDIIEATLAVRTNPTDEAELQKNQTEEQMHAYIQENPEDIETGLRLLQHERGTPYGRVDFYAADSDGNNVVIEVKQPFAKLAHVDQLQRYVNHFRQTPSATVRGILVAPSIEQQVRRTLRDNDLEWVQLDQYQQTVTPEQQTSMDEWS